MAKSPLRAWLESSSWSLLSPADEEPPYAVSTAASPRSRVGSHEGPVRPSPDGATLAKSRVLLGASTLAHANGASPIVDSFPVPHVTYHNQLFDIPGDGGFDTTRMRAARVEGGAEQLPTWADMGTDGSGAKRGDGMTDSDDEDRDSDDDDIVNEDDDDDEDGDEDVDDNSDDVNMTGGRSTRGTAGAAGVADTLPGELDVASIEFALVDAICAVASTRGLVRLPSGGATPHSSTASQGDGGRASSKAALPSLLADVTARLGTALDRLAEAAPHVATLLGAAPHAAPHVCALPHDEPGPMPSRTDASASGAVLAAASTGCGTPIFSPQQLLGQETPPNMVRAPALLGTSFEVYTGAADASSLDPAACSTASPVVMEEDAPTAPKNTASQPASGPSHAGVRATAGRLPASLQLHPISDTHGAHSPSCLSPKTHMGGKGLFRSHSAGCSQGPGTFVASDHSAPRRGDRRSLNLHGSREGTPWDAPATPLPLSVARWKFAPLRDNPYFGPSSADMLRAGARWTQAIVDDGEWWRLITACFLHSGFLHLVLNLVSLIIVGAHMEKRHGAVAIFVILIGSSMAASVVSALFMPYAVSVGFSGGIMGLVAAIYWFIWYDPHCEMRGVKLALLTGTLVVTFITGFLPSVDNFAHIFGAISGFLLAPAALQPRTPMSSKVAGPRSEAASAASPQRHPMLLQRLCVFFCVVAYIVLLLLTTAALFTKWDVNKNCPNCKYLGCIPTKAWTCPFEKENNDDLEFVGNFNSSTPVTDSNSTYLSYPLA
eukprot:jgi/Mesvir1/15987/Mv08292-RA.1